MGNHLQGRKGKFGIPKDEDQLSDLDLKGSITGKMKITEMDKAMCHLQQVDDRESEFSRLYREYRRSAGYPRAEL